jgi:hypothetical protein
MIGYLMENDCFFHVEYCWLCGDEAKKDKSIKYHHDPETSYQELSSTGFDVGIHADFFGAKAATFEEKNRLKLEERIHN